MHRKEKRITAFVIVMAVIGVLLGLPSAAHAALVEPILVEKSEFTRTPTCAQLWTLRPDADEWDEAPWVEIRLAGGQTSATVVLAGYNQPVTVDVTYSSTAGQIASFETSKPVAAVFMKGGDDGLLYVYNEPGVTSDENLNTPLNSNGKFFDVSHINFCFPAEPLEETIVGPVVTKTATAAYTRAVTWTVEKSVAPSGTVVVEPEAVSMLSYTLEVTKDATNRDFVVTGEITVENPNANAEIGYSVSDDLSGLGEECTIHSDEIEAVFPASLTANSSVTYTYRCDVPPSPSGQATNTASVSFTAVGEGQSVSGTVFAGAELNWDEAQVTYVNGPQVTVKDAVLGEVDLLLDELLVDDPDETTASTTFEYDYPVTVPGGECVEVTNSASVVFGGELPVVLDSDSTTTELCAPLPLSVTKASTGTYDLTYRWSIAKTVTPTKVTTMAWEVPATWTITVTKTGPTTGLPTVTADITVSNRNTFPATVTSVADGIHGMYGYSCTPTEALPLGGLVVAAESSATVSVTCTNASSAYAGMPLKNTASVSWVVLGQTGNATGEADVNWIATTKNATTLLTDEMLGISEVLSMSTTVTKASTVAVPAAGCASYTNVATESTGPSSASATIEVCRELNDYGFTIGYWQNKNGQAELKKTTYSTTAVYALAPTVFATISGNLYGTCSNRTGQCSGGYVIGVLSVASASGDGVAMFKAQMLATVLNVLRTPLLGDLGISVGAYGLPGSCLSVDDIIDAADAAYSSAMADGTISDAERATLLKYKSVFDDINNEQAPICDPT
jgi:hypothetical protein